MSLHLRTILAQLCNWWWFVIHGVTSAPIRVSTHDLVLGLDLILPCAPSIRCLSILSLLICCSINELVIRLLGHCFGIATAGIIRSRYNVWGIA